MDFSGDLSYWLASRGDLPNQVAVSTGSTVHNVTLEPLTKKLNNRIFGSGKRLATADMECDPQSGVLIQFWEVLECLG